MKIVRNDVKNDQEKASLGERLMRKAPSATKGRKHFCHSHHKIL